MKITAPKRRKEVASARFEIQQAISKAISQWNLTDNELLSILAQELHTGTSVVLADEWERGE